MDRFLSWFGLARRSEVVRLQGLLDEQTERADDAEFLREIDHKQVERAESDLEFYSKFFDRVEYANQGLRDIHSRMGEVLS